MFTGPPQNNRVWQESQSHESFSCTWNILLRPGEPAWTSPGLAVSHLLEELIHEVVPVHLHHLLIVIAVLSLQTHRKHGMTSCDVSDTQETRQDVTWRVRHTGNTAAASSLNFIHIKLLDCFSFTRISFLLKVSGVFDQCERFLPQTNSRKLQSLSETEKF